MSNDALSVAVIPARGGSRRIPDKNILPFAGRPIIEYSIELARESLLFDRILVSTDSEEIATVAREAGAEVPFMRPENLSGNHTPTAPVVRHAVGWLAKNEFKVDWVCCIYATAPFLQTKYLEKGLRKMRETPGCEFAFSVTSYSSPIFRALKIGEDGFVSMFWPENQEMRSQDLPEAYHDAGQFYWGTPQAFSKHDGMYTSHAVPVLLPRHLVHDIDTPEDWKRAELIFKNLQCAAAGESPAHG